MITIVCQSGLIKAFRTTCTVKQTWGGCLSTGACIRRVSIGTQDNITYKGWTAYTETEKIREGAAGASGTHGSGELYIELN